MNRLLALSIFCFLATQVVRAQHEVDLDTVSIRPVQLTESVYVLYGNGGNIGLLVGDDGPLIVDDQFEEIADSLRAAVGRIADEPIQLAVNTHYHYDHTDGNKALGPEGVIIVAHEKSRARLAEPQTVSMSGSVQDPYPEDALPKITFDHTITLHWNDETVEIIHAPHAHTDGDAIVWFRKNNVFHMGDVFVTYGFPYIDDENGGNLDGIIAACKTVVDLADDDTWFIPGHGEPSRKSDVEEYVSMLEEIRGRIAGMVAKGMTLEEILAAEPLEEMDEDWMTEDAVRRSYQAIMAEKE
jgi:glyoxylase-like metal-dependent hydrolase (beta-lactamase superfamily II)